MAVGSEQNWLGQQRCDTPHLRMVEAGVRGDFDALGYIMVNQTPMIVTGFTFASAVIGNLSNTLSFNVAGSKLIHPLATESGSVFAIPSNRPVDILNPLTNTRMSGSITSGTVNYIGIDLLRSADSTTADTVTFLDPSTNQEYTQETPLRRTIDYTWVITTTPFSYNKSVCPVAVVTVNALGVMTEIVDARPLMGRLSPGGDSVTSTNTVFPYGWPGGRVDSSTSSIAGDKAFSSIKDTINAIETRLWELGGSENWFAVTADRNVNLIIGLEAPFSSSGQNFDITTYSGNIVWKGLGFTYDNSTQYTTTINDQTTPLAGLTDLVNGQCLYVDLDRVTGNSVQAQKGTLSTLGIGVKPGSRWVIVSMVGGKYFVSGIPFSIGTPFSLPTPASTTAMGAILTNIDFTSLTPVAACVSQGYGTTPGIVTGTGLSHNLDYGVAHLEDSAGNLIIGRGSAAGDQDVLIGVTNDYCVTVSAWGGSSLPFFNVLNTSGYPAQPNDTIVSFLDGACSFGGDLSWTSTAITTLPLPPSEGQIKYFTKQSKTWLPEVRCIQYDATGSTVGDWSYNASTQVLTCTSSTSALVIDGVTCAVNDRILFNINGATYNGVFSVVSVGGGSHPTLIRTIDAGGPGSNQLLGYGSDLYAGSAIEVLHGNNYSTTYWVLNAFPQAGVKLDGTETFSFVQSNNTTNDQLCVMFFDGSFSVVTQGPDYTP